MADGTYIPRHGSARPRRYRLRITSELRAVNRFQADIDIAVYGVDNDYFRQTKQMYHVGEWRGLSAGTISGTGSGMFYFDMRGSAVLTEPPYYRNDGPQGAQMEYVDDIMYLTEIDRILAFAVGDAGKGTQRGSPCRNGNCIEAGNISWRCIANFQNPLPYNGRGWTI
jgi:hypothetical protein